MFKSKYLIVFMAAVLLTSALLFLNKDKGQESLTQILKIDKVYGVDQEPTANACKNSYDCTQQQWPYCYTMQPKECTYRAECIACGSYSYDCRVLSPYGDVCWGRDSQYVPETPCGICGPTPAFGGGGGDITCAESMPAPAYRFAIYNPAGAEKAFISAEGYLGIYDTSVFWPFEEAGVVEEMAPNYLCDSTPAGAYLIKNSAGNAVMAFVACNSDSDLDILLDGSLNEFVLNDGNYDNDDYTQTNGNDWVVENGPFESAAAWVDDSGNLYLKACLAESL